MAASSRFSPMVIIIILVAAAAGVGAGYGVEFGTLQPQVDATEAELASANADITGLQGELSQSSRKISELEVESAASAATITELQSLLDEGELEEERLVEAVREAQGEHTKTVAVLDARTSELESVVASLKEARAQILTQQDRVVEAELSKAVLDQKLEFIERSVQNLENDRRLLLALREDAPAGREENRAYWQNIRNLSFQSDQSLAPVTDRVLANLDTYYDWLDVQPALTFSGEELTTAQEIVLWLLDQPVDYNAAIADYQNEVYLIMIIHIREATNALQ